MEGVTASVEGPKRELKRHRVGGDRLLDDDELPFPDISLCFSMGKIRGFDRSMFVVDIWGGRLHEVQRLNGADIVGKRKLHHAAADSKLYLIGESRDVLYCEVSRREGDGLRCDGWKDGPSLQGPKPDPLVATVNGKVYALAGLSRLRDYVGEVNPVFEVLDPKIGNWESLPDPPFLWLYLPDQCGPIITCFAVVGHTIFMHIHNDRGKMKLYSFDTYHTIWKSHGQFIHSDSPSTYAFDYDSTEELIARNLQRYCWGNLLRTADVSENNMMFRCLLDHEGGLTVYVVDLASKKEKIGEDADDEWPLVLFPVNGFDGVTGSLPYSAVSGFVAHLVKKLFCLVLLYFDRVREMMCARACTFEVIEEEGKSPVSRSECSLLAKNVHFKDIDLGKDIALTFYEWNVIRPPPSPEGPSLIRLPYHCLFY